MCASLFDYSVRIALVMLTIGKVSASTKLTILNDQHNLECGMQTVLTCELESPPVFTMHWLVDGASVSECTTLYCYSKDGMSANYNATVTAVGNIFKFYINPVDIFDNKTFTCTDGDASNDINIKTEEVKINKSLTSITNTTEGNSVEFNVTTNCVFHPGAVKLSLESKKVNGNGGFTSFQVESTNTAIVCSNTENAYCGGNMTNKQKINFTISTDTNGGEMHKFKLHIIQALENGTYYTITFDKIGQLKLPRTPTSTTQVNVKVVVIVCVACGCFVIAVIAVVWRCCKTHVLCTYKNENEMEQSRDRYRRIESSAPGPS